MKKVLTLFLFCFLFQQVNSAENDIYKKIDLFGEVLEKIICSVTYVYRTFWQRRKGFCYLLKITEGEIIFFGYGIK